MPIFRQGDFLLSHDLAPNTCLGIESDKLAVCIAYAKTTRVKGLFGMSTFGFRQTNLDFLYDLPWLENVWLPDVELHNLDGLYALSELRYLGLPPKRPGVDFSHFPHLESLIFQPRPKDSNLETLKSLSLLHVWHFRPKNKSFSILKLPESLSELHLNWASPRTLGDLGGLPDLRRLEIHRCRNLEELGDLGKKFPLLEHLVIDTCGKVSVTEAQRIIQRLPYLKHAFIQGKKLV